MKVEGNVPVTRLFIWLNFYHVEPLFSFFFAEIQTLQTAGIDYGGILGKNLMLVDMSQGDIIKGGMGNVTYKACS